MRKLTQLVGLTLLMGCSLFGASDDIGYVKSISPTQVAPHEVPSGAIFMFISGSCPVHMMEVTALDGYTLVGTLAAHSDVGSSGGNATITPTGSVAAPVFTGTSSQVTSATSAGTPAGSVAAPNFTGTASQVTSPTSGGTPAGSNTLGAFAEGAISWPAGVPTNTLGAFTEGAISWPAGVPTVSGVPGLGTLANVASATTGNCAATNIAAGTGSTTACKASAPNLTMPAEGHTGALTAGTLANAWPAGVPTIGVGSFTQPTVAWPAGVPTIATGSFTNPTFTGSLLATHTHTLTPAGTNDAPAFTGSALGTHTHTLTPAGTNSAPAFTGNAVDPHPPFIKVIFCIYD